MSRPLAVEGETISTLGRVRSNEVPEEEIYRRIVSTGNSQSMNIRTKVVLRAGFELLVHHELLNLPRHRLNVVDNQLIQIGELMRAINHKLGAHCLARRISVEFDNICSTAR